MELPIARQFHYLTPALLLALLNHRQILALAGPAPALPRFRHRQWPNPCRGSAMTGNLTGKETYGRPTIFIGRHHRHSRHRTPTVLRSTWKLLRRATPSTPKWIPRLSEAPSHQAQWPRSDFPRPEFACRGTRSFRTSAISPNPWNSFQWIHKGRFESGARPSTATHS